MDNYVLFIWDSDNINLFSSSLCNKYLKHEKTGRRKFHETHQKPDKNKSADGCSLTFLIKWPLSHTNTNLMVHNRIGYCNGPVVQAIPVLSKAKQNIDWGPLGNCVKLYNFSSIFFCEHM